MNLVFVLITNAVWANGQSTHCWISEQARSFLVDPDLAEIMNDPELEVFWRNGSMFPDGGYPLDDPYAEIAHWEPFQKSYMLWIKESFEPPYEQEALQHIAFLMGLASHGMADQTFDSMYMSRAKVYDKHSDWTRSMDEATDVVFVAQTHPQPVPDIWIPGQLFKDIYDSEFEHVVSVDTLEDGQTLLQVAILYVSGASENSELLTSAQEAFPWATSNLLDESISGSPPVEALVVAQYWEHLWRELHDEGWRNPSILAFFAGSFEEIETLEAQSPESGLSLVFSTGLSGGLFSEQFFVLKDAQGREHPFEAELFYGGDSHVVNISPLQNWTLGEYTLEISSDLTFRDGQKMGEQDSLVFSVVDHSVDKDLAEEDNGCRSKRGMILLALLMGWRRNTKESH